MEERLQKILARCGFGSRRACEEYIQMGRVSVNGTTAELGSKADPKKDTITIAAGDWHTINGGNGVDVITVNKGNYHKINGDSGNDTITLKNKGWDESNWWDGRKDTIHGNAGNDTIKVLAGRHEIYGDAGNDTITLGKNVAERNEVYGGAGNDSITVNGGNYHTIYAGSSAKKKKDVITINKGTGTTVYGEEGIDKILADAGFELRLPSCSACLAMNPDKVPAGKLAISTSNRNFVGRQGPGARTILASPLTVAASAITGKVTDPRKI